MVLYIRSLPFPASVKMCQHANCERCGFRGRRPSPTRPPLPRPLPRHLTGPHCKGPSTWSRTTAKWVPPMIFMEREARNERDSPVRKKKGTTSEGFAATQGAHPLCARNVPPIVQYRKGFGVYRSTPPARPASSGDRGSSPAATFPFCEGPSTAAALLLPACRAFGSRQGLQAQPCRSAT